MLRKISRPSFSYHQTYHALGKAADLAESDIAILSLPIVWPPKGGLISKRAGKVLERLCSILTHYRLIGRVWGERKRDLVIVREFSNIPLFLAWPLLSIWRKRCRYLINHNVQLATKSAPDRWALRLLSKMGCRYLCIEGDAGFDQLGIEMDDGLVSIIPFPVEHGTDTTMAANMPSCRYVGVIGRFRKEKGSDALLSSLSKARKNGEFDARLLLGCPDQAYLESWEQDGFEIINTTSNEMYQEAMRRCDVIVLNYERDSYYFRHSGVIADAVSSGKIVVCPGFPLLKSQVSVPTSVGFTFDDLNFIGGAVNSAIQFACQDHEAAFQAHYHARGCEMTARLLDKVAMAEAVN